MPPQNLFRCLSKCQRWLSGEETNALRQSTIRFAGKRNCENLTAKLSALLYVTSKKSYLCKNKLFYSKKKRKIAQKYQQIIHSELLLFSEYFVLCEYLVEFL